MDPIAMRGLFDSIAPMLASPQNGTILSTLTGTHYFDIKLDGVRCMALWDGHDLVLRNRTGKDVTHRYPDLQAYALQKFDEPMILDGEIVAVSGSFQDTARRDKQNKPEAILRTAHEVPVEFIAFDLLHLDGRDLRHEQNYLRRVALDGIDDLGGMFTRSICSDRPELLDKVIELGMEGVIAKRNRASYRGGRSGEWIKFKVTHSVTCVAVGYEPGKGARADFGAMFIAVLDGTTPVPVGRVGSGFTRSQIDAIKADLDAGKLPLVEIECANVTKDGSLRFPVFKGERTDQTLADANIAQLASIPRT